MTYEHPWYTQLSALESTTTLGSELTQNPKSETTGQKSTKQCFKCKQIKPLSEFRTFHANQNVNPYRRNECITCEKHDAKVRAKCHKEATPKPLSCQLCGVSDKKLVMDHCHDTETFRGWLCQTCNKGLGCFSDNISNLHKAINYLSTHA